MERVWLRELREQKGYTKVRMGELLEMTPEAYGLIERGERRKDMTLVLANQLSRIFKVSLHKINQCEIALEKEGDAGSC